MSTCARCSSTSTSRSRSPGPELMPEGYVSLWRAARALARRGALRGRARRRARRSQAASRPRPRRGDLGRVHRADRRRHGRHASRCRTTSPSSSRAGGSVTRTSSSTRTSCPCSTSCGRRGLKIGLVSNSARDVRDFARHHALEIDAGISSFHHGKTKPHGSIFKAVLDLLEVEPARRRDGRRHRRRRHRRGARARHAARCSSTGSASTRTTSRASTTSTRSQPCSGYLHSDRGRMACLGDCSVAARRGRDLHAGPVLPRADRGRRGGCGLRLARRPGGVAAAPRLRGRRSRLARIPAPDRARASAHAACAPHRHSCAPRRARHRAAARRQERRSREDRRRGMVRSRVHARPGARAGHRRSRSSRSRARRRSSTNKGAHPWCLSSSS